MSSSSSVLSTATSTSSIASTASTTLSSTTGSSTPTGSAVSFLPPGWDYYGCYIDGTPLGRILSHEQDMNNLTIQECVSYCISGGYTIAGLEYRYAFEQKFLHVLRVTISVLFLGNTNARLCDVAFNVSVTLLFTMERLLQRIPETVSYSILVAQFPFILSCAFSSPRFVSEGSPYLDKLSSSQY